MAFSPRLKNYLNFCHHLFLLRSRSTLKKLPSSHSQKNNIFKKQSLIKIGLFCSALIMKQLLFVDDRKKNNSFILRSKFEVAKSQLFLKFACLRPFSTKMVPLFIDKLGFQKRHCISVI